jgi:hypothetical protein
MNLVSKASNNCIQLFKDIWHDFGFQLVPELVNAVCLLLEPLLRLCLLIFDDGVHR